MIIWNVKVGSIFRLIRKYNGIRAKTGAKLVVVGKLSLTVEFACQGKLIDRHLLLQVNFADFAANFKPVRIFPHEGTVVMAKPDGAAPIRTFWASWENKPAEGVE